MIVRIGTNEYQGSITERSDMTDTYLNFANSPFGAKLAETLGLPKPLKLERYKPGQPVIKGTVLVGGGGEPQLLETLAAFFQSIGAQTVAHSPSMRSASNHWSMANRPSYRTTATRSRARNRGG